MRRTDDRVVTHTPTRREAKMAKMAAATTTPERIPPATPGTARDEEDGPGSSARGMMMGRKRRGYAARGTPESVVRAPTMVMAEALRSPSPLRRDGARETSGFESPGANARAGEAREDGANDAMDDGMDARGGEEEFVYGTPPASPRARNEPLACPATPFKAQRTRGVCLPGGESAGQSAPRPRGRVVRSLLEEFNAAERGLEEMLEARSDNTTLKNVNLDDFDPFDEPDSAGQC